MIRRLAVAVLLIVPSIALAQRGGRTQADRKTPLFDKEEMPKGPTLRVRDVEDQSPIKLLIDKRKDLKLSDAQVSQLKDTETKLKDVNAPLFKAVDSLIRDMRNGSGSSSDQARAKVRDARSGLMDVLNQLKGNYETPLKDALAQFDAEQQAKANELLEKQRQDGDKMIREKLNSGGGGERP
jgi:hypothetical protein